MESVAGFIWNMHLSVLNAAIARSKHMDYLFGLSQVFVGISGIFFFLIVPILTTTFGTSGIFGFVTFIALISLFFVGRLPEPKTDTVEYHSDKTSIPPPFLTITNVCVLGALILCFIGGQGIWTYLDRVGNNLGVSTEVLGICLSVGAALSLLGPWFAQRMLLGIDRIILITSCLVILALIAVIATTTSSPLIYTIAIIPKQFITLFFMTVFLGYLGIIEPDGRLAAAASGCINFGTALAPAVSGVLLIFGSYELIGIGAAVFEAIGILLIFYAKGSINHVRRNF